MQIPPVGRDDKGRGVTHLEVGDPDRDDYKGSVITYLEIGDPD